MATATFTTIRYPGQPAMWFFVIGDLWIFSCYFACYIYDRANDTNGFLIGQAALNQNIGFFNTILLLTSSLFVAFAVQANRSGMIRHTYRFLYLTIGCGILFLVIKGFEWYQKVAVGFPSGSEEYFLYYFMFTGLHFLHVCLGLVFLLILMIKMKSQDTPHQDQCEAAATYWHMVDFLWVIIFALLYLMR